MPNSSSIIFVLWLSLVLLASSQPSTTGVGGAIPLESTTASTGGGSVASASATSLASSGGSAGGTSGGLVGAASAGSAGNISCSSIALTSSCSLRQDMRKLWADHVVWDRLFIIATVDNDGSAPFAVDRLMQNTIDLGNAFAPALGNQVGQNLTSLLREHILIGDDVAQAAVQGNTTGMQEANALWYQNAQQIALFLSNASSQWPFDSVLIMLNNHLNLTNIELLSRIQKNFTGDVVIFDAIFTQVMSMADTFSEGILMLQGGCSGVSAQGGSAQGGVSAASASGSASGAPPTTVAASSGA